MKLISILFLIFCNISLAVAEESMYEDAPPRGYVINNAIIYDCDDVNKCEKIIRLRPICNVVLGDKPYPESGWYEITQYYCMGKSSTFTKIYGYIEEKNIEITTVKKIEPWLVSKASNSNNPPVPHFQIRRCPDPECPIIFDSAKDDSTRFLASYRPSFEPEEPDETRCFVEYDETQFVDHLTGGWFPISTAFCFIRETKEPLSGKFIRVLPSETENKLNHNKVDKNG